MRLRFSFLLFFTALLLLPYPSCAQTSGSERAGVIRGTVSDPDGCVVPDADVTLLGSMIVAAEVKTDARGEYKFEALDAGAYSVVANAPGFTGGSSEIQLQAGEARVADLRLKITAVQDQVVVSASFSGALAPEVGTSVTVVSHDEIQDQGAVNVADALRNVPGVEINRTGQMGAVTSAFIRGGNSNYNLVMIDGIPLNDFGGAFDLSPLPTAGVEQVEVLRGPQSALYGSNAVAGAINILSNQGDSSPRFNFEGEGGSYDTYRITTGGEGLTDGLGWAYNLSRIATHGPVERDTYWNQTSFVSLSYSRSPRRKIVGHYFGDTGAAQNPGPWGSDPNGTFLGIPASYLRQKQNLFAYQASETEQVNSRFQQVSTVSVSTDRYSFPATPGSFDFASFENNLRLVANTRSEFVVSAKDVFVAGFEYDREQYKDTYVANPDFVPFVLPRNNYAFFAENRWNPGSRWFVSTGLRVDSIHTGSLVADPINSGRPFIPATSVTQVNPRISVAYLARQSDSGAVGMTRIHSSFGTGIRPPDGFELAFTDNPQLKPERSISADAGIEQRFFNDRAVFDVTYFYNDFKDQIISTGVFPTASYTTENIARSRAWGLETSMRLRPLRSLEVIAEYTWLNSAILSLDGLTEAPPPFEVGQPLIRRPRSSAGYSVTWTRGRLMLNSSASIRSAVLDTDPTLGTFACSSVPPLPCLFRNPGYVDANAGFAVQLPRGVEIYGHVYNFLNEHYEESFGFPALRVNFLSGIRFEIPTRHDVSAP
jgi:outer membrane receptor protein involved in Fe transport